MILSSAGILLLAFGLRMYFSAMLSIGFAGQTVDAAAAQYQAAIWRNLFFFLADPGLMAWGLGLFLFGRLVRESAIVPKWLGAVGMIGGVAGLLTDAVYRTPALAIVQFSCFAIWGFVLGVMLLRHPNEASR